MIVATRVINGRNQGLNLLGSCFQDDMNNVFIHPYPSGSGGPRWAVSVRHIPFDPDKDVFNALEVAITEWWMRLESYRREVENRIPRYEA